MTELVEIPVFVMPTEYTVCALSMDHREYGHYAVTVEWRGDDRWAVMHFRLALGTDGEWDFEPSPSSREDDWLETHRFDLQTALKLAREVAPDITCNGFTIADVLARTP